MPKRILILTTDAGGGHIAITNAVCQYLKLIPNKTLVKTLNTTLAITSPAYRLVGEYFSSFHQTNWQASNSPKAAKLLNQLNTPLLLPKLIKSVNTFKPNLIIATDPFSPYTLKVALHNLKLKIPYLIVVADPFTIHHAWTANKNANHYLAPTKEVKQILVKRNIKASNITVTGLPLRQTVFTPQINQSQARYHLNLDPEKITLFIGGSGEGHGQIHKLTKNILTHPQAKSRCQLIVVAGKNKLLKSRLNTLKKKHPQLKFFGYTDLIDQLIIASDFVVGKPGPNILFESLMLNKPFLATSQPLSQELGNYHYITQQKLGLVTHKPARTLEAIIKLVNHPRLLKTFQPGIKKHQRLYQNTPQATLKVIQKYL